MNDIKNKYRCVTDPTEVRAYLGDSKIVSFDYETAPDEGYRDEDKVALDAAKSHICTLSLSVREHTGIMIPVAHKVGPNMPKAEFDALLTEFLTDRSIIKVAHNLSFEAMFSYAKGIVIMPPMYDTIAASQMTLKNAYDFRKLSDSGLKKLAGELRAEKEELLLQEANKEGIRQRIADMMAYLQSEPEEVTEYSEALVRRMIEKITVYDDHFVVEFKSGIEITINE